MELFRTTEADDWEAYLRRNQYSLDVRAISPGFSARVQSAEIARGVSLFQMSAGRSTLARTDRLVRSAPSDDLLLLMQLTGRARIEQGDSRLELTGGQAVFFDPGQPYTIDVIGGDHFVILVPRREILGPSGSAASMRLRPIPLLSAPLRVLLLLGEEMVSWRPEGGGFERDGVAAAAVDLLRTSAVLAATATTSGSRLLGRESVGEAARAYIKDNITDSDLSVENVARALHVSVRHLTASFGPEDSPGAYLRRVRLEGIRADLLDPRYSHLTVGRIAANWGYTNASSFGRAFRQRFGHPATDMRHG